MDRPNYFTDPGYGSPAAQEPEAPQSEIPQEGPAQAAEPVCETPPVEEAPKPVSKKHHSHKLWGIAAAIAVVAAIGCVIVVSVQNARLRSQMELQLEALNNRIGVLQEQLEDSSVAAGSTEPVTNESDGSAATAPEGALTPGQVYAQNVQAVVAISSQAISTNVFGQVSETASAGSGFIISPDGYVVTNCHVIEGATDVSVITHDSQTHTAQVIGSDSTNDVALLKIEGEDFPYVTIGSSDALAVGDQVTAIGNPLGKLTSTLTVGYVSAKDRMVTTDGTTINMLQTDAAINSGNSGGPLFNMYGQVVGITTAKYSGTSSSGATIEGIGFAIPMDDIVGIIEDLQAYGYVTSAYLGVMVRDVDSTAQSYGLPAGAYVEEVVSGYAAEAAGLKVQDIIIDLGGYAITCNTDLTHALRRLEPGETTTITVYRSGSELVLSITLDEKPQDTTTEQEQTATVPSQDSFNGFEDYFDYFFGNGWG